MIDLSAGRGPFICQSQSLNLYVAEPSFPKLSSMHFYAWKQGLKTGQYYLRTRPARDAIKFTVDIGALLKASEEGNNTELLKVLNTTQNKEKKKKKAVPETEDPLAKKQQPETEGQKANEPAAAEKEESEEEDFPDLVCENCSG
jgi:ribonucleotide reductase alpha subunit